MKIKFLKFSVTLATKNSEICQGKGRVLRKGKKQKAKGNQQID